jgi:hypothetical protein
MSIIRTLFFFITVISCLLAHAQEQDSSIDQSEEIVLPTQFSNNAKITIAEFLHLVDHFSSNLIEQTSQLHLDSVHIDQEKNLMVFKMTKKKKNKIVVYWGYNRSFHTAADTWISTDKGEIIIRRAKGYDRPSKNPLTYIDPTKFTIPQFNFKVGYHFNEWLRIVAGTDHMKLVIKTTEPAEKVEGNYQGPLFNRFTGEQLTWEEILETGDISFLQLEHTDGYNYPFVGLEIEKPIFEYKTFKVSYVGGAGIGIMFPKTLAGVSEAPFKMTVIDNRYKVAGAGAHVNGELKLSVQNKKGVEFFISAWSKGTAIKIWNAYYLEDQGKIEHAPIYSLQLGVSGGVHIPLFNKK